MKLFVCGGGTGGHINPALAVASFVKERRPDTEIVFGGATRGMEAKLVPAQGYPLRTVDVSGFKRSFMPEDILFNIGAAWRMMTSESKALEIVRKEAPDLLFGTGGYACYPYAKAANKLGIPVILHESNALPGKAVMAAGKFSEKILLGFPEAVERLPEELRDRAVVTGNPIRSGMTFKNKNEVKKKLGYSGKLVVSFWGSLGAREMNKIMASFIQKECEEKPDFDHVHATGSYGWRWMPDLIREKGINLSAQKKVNMQEYIQNMPDLLAACDLAICRAGAMTTIELAATGTPAIIVPSPNVAENHQESNARALEKRGAARVILEKDCTAERLYRETQEILQNEAELDAMSKAALKGAILDADQRIYDVLSSYMR